MSKDKEEGQEVAKKKRKVKKRGEYKVIRRATKKKKGKKIKQVVLSEHVDFSSAIKNVIVELSKKNMSISEIAEIIGVSPRTLYYWKKKDSTLCKKIKNAKDIASDLVEASLFQRAMGYKTKETKVFCQDGEIITTDIEKQYPPDTTSMIFWLKNRRPEVWKEKQKGEDDKTITINDLSSRSDEELKDMLKTILSEED